MSGQQRKRFPPADNRRNSRRSPSAKNFVTKTEIKGTKVSPSSNPPDITQQPWYPYVVTDTFAGSKNYTVKIICDILRTRMDPNGWGLNPTASDSPVSRVPFRIQVRIQAVYVWNLSGKFITLSIEDFHDTNSASGGRDQLCGLIDSGTQLHTPAVGYRLPLNSRQTVLRNDDVEGGIYIAHSQSADGDLCLIHFHILWRFDGPSKPPTFTGVSLFNISEDLRVLNDAAKTLKDITEENRKEKPSTISKIINGVQQLALLVSTVTADETLKFEPSRDGLISITESECSVPAEQDE